MNPSLTEELKLYKKGFTRIAGGDEAGRGPLAGPVVAAVVVLNVNAIKKLCSLGIKDSKQLSRKKRDDFYRLIKKQCLGFSWSRAGERTIDKYNIHRAANLALKRAILKCKTRLNFLLLDGCLRLNNNFLPQKTIIRGDEKCVSIAAASIIAKVERDKIMERMHEKYPRYNFRRHKGYSTGLHIDRLNKYGPCKIHRKSFGRVKELARSS